MADIQHQSMRVWTGSDGKFEVEASYIGLFQNTKVKLRKQGGGMIAVPLNRLCEADVAYIAARSGLSNLTLNDNNNTNNDIAGTITTAPGTVDKAIMQKPDNPSDVNIPSPTLGISFAAETITTKAIQNNETAAITAASSPPLTHPQQQAEVPIAAMQTLSVSNTILPFDGYFSPRPHEHAPSSTPAVPNNMAQAPINQTQPPSQQSLDRPNHLQNEQHNRSMTSPQTIINHPPVYGHTGYSQEEQHRSTTSPQQVISYPPPHIYSYQPQMVAGNHYPGYPQQEHHNNPPQSVTPSVKNIYENSLSSNSYRGHQNHAISTPPITTTMTATSYSQQQQQLESHAATETFVLTKIEHSGPQRVRAMRPESVQLLSQRSLSSITEKLIHSPQGQWQPRPQTLAGFPPNVLATIGKFLDARTRVRLANVCRSFLQAMFRPHVWRHIWFLHQDLYRVDSSMIHAMTQTLKGYQLYHAVYTVVLDGSAVTADSVVHVLLNFLSLRQLSIKSCWQVYSFPLCGKLMQLATTGQRGAPIQLEKIELGKALRRGIDKKEAEKKPNLPQSFGQDVEGIRTALEQLAGRPVQIDCYLCDFCHVGVSGPMLMCFACGPLHIHKCTHCAPKCDRCSTRICNMPQCRGKSIQITTEKCGQCEKALSICNQPHNQACLAAKKPCEKCNSVYHVQCRTNDGGYISNQCSRCGIVACPTCELSGCAGGCLGQWCRGCIEHVDLAHCKCFVLERKTGGKMRKKNVCKNCRKGCAKCSTGGFCARCLGVHKNQCR
ncbi:hypothetical protein BDC45DRAFT_514535 [Circinella umbellata]|nr:hypothetical protein BDC45DRAFT_514535 [Circinella umbellata]